MEKTDIVCCEECFFANLIQYGNDPLLAECRRKPQDMNERFPYQVEVARHGRLCRMHKHQDRAEKTVQQRVAVSRWPSAQKVGRNAGRDAA